jgi:hypothetical protein
MREEREEKVVPFDTMTIYVPKEVYCGECG